MHTLKLKCGSNSRKIFDKWEAGMHVKAFNNKIKTETFYCIPGIFKRNEQTVQGIVNFCLWSNVRE